MTRKHIAFNNQSKNLTGTHLSVYIMIAQNVFTSHADA